MKKNIDHWTLKRDHINEVVKLSSFHLWCDFVSIYFAIERKQKKAMILLLVLVKRNNGTNSKAVLLLLKSVDKSFLPYAGKLFKQR